MKLCIQLLFGRYVILFSAYTPALHADEEADMSFYEVLHTAIVSTPNYNKLIILSDFNAQVGRGYEI